VVIVGQQLTTQKIAFFVPKQYQHQTKSYSQQPSLLGDSVQGSVMADQMNSQAAYSHYELATLSTVRLAVKFPTHLREMWCQSQCAVLP